MLRRFFFGGGEFADYFHYYARPCTLHEPGITSYYSVTSNYAYQVTRKPRLQMQTPRIVFQTSVQCKGTDTETDTSRKSKARLLRRQLSYYTIVENQYCDHGIMSLNKKLSCRRETARRFVSLNILPNHLRSFEMTLLNTACVSPYWYFIETMSVCRTVQEMFSVKEWRDLETGGRDCSQGH